MIAGIFHKGSGLGNQLHRYVMTRVLAADKEFDFGMVNPENFKGKGFMNLDMGKPVKSLERVFNEKRIDNRDGVDIRSYDPDLSLVEDDTVIDGEFQGEKYFEHRLDDIRQWLEVEPFPNIPDDLCVINFRGGEYQYFPDLFLTEEYWQQAIRFIQTINPKMKFEVHTDDMELATKYFPTFNVISEIEYNWRSIRYAKYLILSNSSFAILPALLNQRVEKIIAPWGWARRNKGYWALSYNEYSKFTHI